MNICIGDISITINIWHFGITITTISILGAIAFFRNPLLIFFCKIRFTFLSKLLLSCGADPNACGKNGRTILIEASSIKGGRDLVNRLLEKGAEINKQDDNGIAPIMEASKMGYRLTVETLIRYGANVNCVTNNGWTALMYAVKFRHPKVAYSLLKYKPEMEKYPKYKTADSEKVISRGDHKGKKAVDFLTPDIEAEFNRTDEGKKVVEILNSTRKPAKKTPAVIPTKKSKTRGNKK